MAGVPMVENCVGGYNSCMFAYGQVSPLPLFSYYSCSSSFLPPLYLGTHYKQLIEAKDMQNVIFPHSLVAWLEIAVYFVQFLFNEPI